MAPDGQTENFTKHRPSSFAAGKNCVFLPAEGKQNATFSPEFTQPGKSLLEIPCILLDTMLKMRSLCIARFAPPYHLIVRTPIGIALSDRLKAGAGRDTEA